jgi:small-conductance mechanosensitive channel
LKDTLENLFGGIYLLYDKVVKVGDVIRLESGQEGKVEDISWRTTRVLLSDSNTVFVPNSKLAQSIVTNFCIPTDQVTFPIQFTIDNDNDLAVVEAAVQKAISEGEREFDAEKIILGAVIRFDPGFVESGLCYTIRITVSRYSEQAKVRHFLRRKIHEAFKEAKVKWVQTSLKLDTGKSPLPALN